MATSYTRRITLYINDKEVTNDIKSIQNAYFKANNELKRMELGSKEYIDQIKKIKGIKSILDEHNQALKNVQKTGLTFSKISDSFNKYFGIITAGAASFAGLIMAGKKAVDTFNEFEAKISELSALTGLAGDDLKWLTDQAKELSTSTVEGGIKITKSANDILEAYKLMGSAKPELLADKEALNEVTKQALILAEAAKMDTGPAVESLANIMNQFNAPASDAAKYVNILAAGSQAGAAEVGDLAVSIIKSGAAAQQANVTIEQEVALIETLAEKGVKAEVAGTGLKTFLLKLQAGADDTNPAIVGMNTALENLAAKNMSAAEMTKEFGLESYTVASLLINNRQRFDELTTAVTGTTTAYQQAAINTDNNAAKLAQAQNRAQLMRIELGEKLAPVMTHFVSTGSLMLKMLSALVDLFSKHGSEILLVAGSIAAYTLAVKIQTAETKANVLWTKIAAGAQTAWGTIVGLLTNKIKIATVAQKIWNAIMAMNPIGAIVAGTMALAAGIVFLVKKMNAQTAAQKAVNDVTEQAKRDIIEQKNKTQDLLAVAKNQNLNIEQRKAAIAELNRISPEYFGNLSIEKSTTEDLTKAGEAYIANLEKQALAKAAQAKIDELRTENANKEIDIETKKKKWFESTEGAARRARKSIEENKEAIQALQGIVDKNKPAVNTATDLKSTTTIETIATGPSEDELKKQADAKKKAQEKAFAELELEQRKSANLLKQQLLDKTLTEDEYNSQSLAKELEFLVRKKDLQTKFGEDTTDTEAAILDKKLKAQEDADKKAAEQKKKEQEKTLKTLELQQDAEMNIIKKQLANGLIAEDEAEQLLLAKEIEFLNKKIALKKQYGEDTADLEGQILDKTQKIAENAAKGDEERLKQLNDLRKEFADEEVLREQEKAAKLSELNDIFNTEELRKSEEYQRLKSAITEKYEKNRFEIIQKYLEGASRILGILSDANNAAKDRELAKAGDNAAKKEAIEKKYAKKSQKIAIAQAAINGALAVTKILAETPKADFGIMTGILIAAAVATTAAEVAAISNQQFKVGGFTSPSSSDSTPVGVVHANEWVASAPLLRDPVARRHIDYLENMQRGLTPRFDTTTIAAAAGGFQNGGFTSNNTSPSATTTTIVQQSDSETKALMAGVLGLLQKLDTEGVKSNINALEIQNKANSYNSAISASGYE